MAASIHDQIGSSQYKNLPLPVSNVRFFLLDLGLGETVLEPIPTISMCKQPEKLSECPQSYKKIYILIFPTGGHFFRLAVYA